LAWRWRQDSALFLLLWFPALLLPSFLATDRWPTLPRVLGTIPGVYFFPAVGLVGVAVFVQRLGRRGGAQAGRVANIVAAALLILAPVFHTVTTYRDYFRIWGPSEETFDAFEGDMTAAWRWLKDHPAAGHVYLSSDIYRHPTFMLLHERASVQTYWQHANPDLSWFDARYALPLPAAGEQAIYLIASSSPLPHHRLFTPGCARGVLFRIGPRPTVTGERVTEQAAAGSNSPDIVPALDTRAASPVQTDTGEYVSAERQTSGRILQFPIPLEIRMGGENAGASTGSTVLDVLHHPSGGSGRFLSWHRLRPTGTPPTNFSFRPISQQDGKPVTGEHA
jgi:hypothetical protein